jgi:pimeloyl-ACP methyl ester carboxylesterase
LGVDSTFLRCGNLVFAADVAGPPDGPLVLLLHGFPQTRYTWRHQLPALADAGYRALAPDQRGYSPGARPAGVDAYAIELLVGDALALADALGAERFHLVGHDWGGQLAWWIAAHHAERVRTLSVLSRPHPAAFRTALASDPGQAGRSSHHRAFQDPATAERMLEDDARRLRRALGEQGVPEADVAAYLETLSERDALDAALHWYRAAFQGDSTLARDLPGVAVPTLYLWGDADATVGRSAAEGTEEHVQGPFRFEVIPGVGHFLTDQAPERVTALLLEHLRRHA